MNGTGTDEWDGVQHDLIGCALFSPSFNYSSLTGTYVRSDVRFSRSRHSNVSTAQQWEKELKCSPLRSATCSLPGLAAKRAGVRAHVWGSAARRGSGTMARWTGWMGGLVGGLGGRERLLVLCMRLLCEVASFVVQRTALSRAIRRAGERAGVCVGAGRCDAGRLGGRRAGQAGWRAGWVGGGGRSLRRRCMLLRSISIPSTLLPLQDLRS